MVELNGEVVSELVLDQTSVRARLDTVGADDRAGGGGGRGARWADRRRRAAVARRRGAPFALPAGADPGPQDGAGDDLLAGTLRLHAHQPDPDPPRPLRLRQVRQARGRLQRRVAGGGDPQDPAHLGPAQHRPLRRRQPRPGDRQLRHLRRPRLRGRRHVRHRPRGRRHAGRQPRRSATSASSRRSSPSRRSSSASSPSPPLPPRPSPTAWSRPA